MIGKYREDYYLAQDAIDALDALLPKLEKLGFVSDDGYRGQILGLMECLRTMQIYIQDEYNDRV